MSLRARKRAGLDNLFGRQLPVGMSCPAHIVHIISVSPQR